MVKPPVKRLKMGKKVAFSLRGVGASAFLQNKQELFNTLNVKNHSSHLHVPEERAS